MKKLLIFSILILLAASSSAQRFEDYFEDRTLRLDYTFSGDVHQQQLYVDELVSIPRWHGKRSHLSEVPLKGNGQIIVRSKADGTVIFRHSFSTLFQEWLSTDEAKHVRKSFENVFLIPFPKQPVEITVEIYDYHAQVNAALTHTVDPSDILIREAGASHITPYTTLQQAADTSRCIRIAYVAEGYRQEEMDTFLKDCQIAMEALFQHEPFRQKQACFNIVAVQSPSLESGTSWPAKGIWKNTVLGSHFDTFYSDRYLTTLHLKKLHDVLAGIPYEHIIILVNTDHYGGGGIYNSYNLSYAHGEWYRPVVVHEFGHSFGGLGDEYTYGNDDPMYFPDTEPWEPNLTTKHDFNEKWADLVKEGKAGLFEGGGYMEKGIWRAYENCRMRSNVEPEFCPVCQRALLRLISFYTD